MESTPKSDANAQETPKPTKDQVNDGTEDKPKRERRQRKPKAPKDSNAANDGEPSKEDSKPVENGVSKEEGESKPKRVRKEKPKKEDRPETADGDSKPMYRKKGEVTEKLADESVPTPGQDKPKKERRPRTAKEPKDATTAGAPEDGVEPGAEPAKKEKRKRGPKPDKDAQDGEKPKEPKYRPKGEKTEETEGDAKDEGATKDGTDKGEKKKDADAPKNLIYKNPMDFKEKRKFKSKWEEYRHGDWRKGSGKTFVTLETEIPNAPEKLLKPPEEKAFHSKQVEMEDRIKEITSTLEEKKTSFEDILLQKNAQMKAGDSGVVYSKELGEKFQRMKVLMAERKVIYNAMDKADGDRSTLVNIVEQMRAKIDRHYNKEDLIPKALKQAEKDFTTTSGNYQKEQEYLRRVQFLKDSIPCIQKRDAADAKLKAMSNAKKEAGVNLPKVKSEIKILQAEIDKLKEGQTAKTETKATFDQQLDDINARRKKLRDERDKIYKQKEELRDTYYGSLITYTKQQYLLQDIAWMTDMQTKLKVRKEEKDKRDKEYQERKERITKEREERKQREEDRKTREKERKEKEAENKKHMEEQLKQDEIDKLKKYDADIDDQGLASSPLFEQIEQCDKLTVFCNKQIEKLNNPEAAKEEEKKESKEEAQVRIKGELQKAVAKGSIMLADNKKEDLVFEANTKKSKKTRKNRDQDKEGTVDINLIKKFNSLKISAPITPEDYEKTLKDLSELRDALVYWGKIIQRQNKIKFIRNSRKISQIDEYIQMAEEEEKFIENEKSKFDSADTAKEINISLEKLKMAQIIDRENRQNRVWKDESEDEDYDSEEEEDKEEAEKPVKKRGGQVDLYDDEDKKKKPKKQRKQRPTSDDEVEEVQVKKTQRPNAQKFKEIMKAEDNFPTLDMGDDLEGEDDLGDTPAGEIDSQEG